MREESGEQGRPSERSLDAGFPPDAPGYGEDAWDEPLHLGDEVGLASEWAVPWSDLMMVMFILFVALFVYHVAEREVDTAFEPDPIAETAVAPLPIRGGASQPPEAVLRQSMELVREAELADVDVVLQADRSVKVSIRGPMFFELGRAELRDETRTFLDRLSNVIGRADARVRVVGHTDNFPIHSDQFPTNWELSAARAAAVVRHLIRESGAPPDRFTIEGRSMHAPAVPNTSLENKARNRRVEIIIARADPPEGGAP